MNIPVRERALSIATFRFIHVRLMEIAARWTPSIPEMEVKVMLGRHIWDFAQQADTLGKRTFELRLPEQHSLPPTPEYLGFLDAVVKAKTTSERIASLYEGVLPGLERRYRAYIAQTDPILDEPSILILQRILGDFERQRREAAEVRSELALPQASAAPFATREGAIANVVVLA
ncbi:MAG TPA: hypothetical protein VI391_02695 [Thermoanaerobaculia bacterium]